MASHPRQEAEDVLGGRYSARVLEPSPPAVGEPPWFADDPVARGGDDGRPVVSPVATGDLFWQDVARGDPRLAAWCAARWLGPYQRLAPPPPGFTATRTELHRVAGGVLAPARQHAPGGKIGLRWTRGGFGTPYFEADVQLRVFGDRLIQQTGDREQSRAIGGVDADASRWLGELFGFAVSVLEELRAEAGAADDPSRVQIWPEHFDMALEVGPKAAGRRATFGVSPGDAKHDAPYAYVTPWTTPPADAELWNSTTFDGAILPFTDVLGAADQRQRALRFFRARRAALA